MKRFLIFIFFCHCINLSGQINLLNSGTTTNLYDLSVIGNNIMLCGRNNYLAKSYDACNSLTLLEMPVYPGYYNQLYRLDSLNLFLLSSTALPSTNQVHTSTDGGNTWIKKIDTTGIMMKAMGFFDTQEGIAIRYPYFMMRTKNGGLSWTNEPSPTVGASALEIFGDSTVIAGDGNGSFYLSKDRGNTWPISDGVSNPVADIFFLNKDTVFVISSQAGFSGDPNSMSKSFNGGLSWQHSTIPLGNPQGVFFKNAKEGYVVGSTFASGSDSGNGMILKTTDLGQTWTSFDPQINSGLINLEFLNDSIALVSGYDGVLFTWNSKQAVFTSLEQHALDQLSIKLGPNPVQDKLLLEIPEARAHHLQFSILNTLGQAVCTGAVLAPKQEIDLGGLSAGIYFLRISNGSGQKVVKLVKDK